MEQKLIEYKKAGFFDTKTVGGKEILHLSAPCRFRIIDIIVADLKNNCKSDKEIGGILWSKPTILEGEIIHIIDKVSYIRNAIGDNPRTDYRNSSNTYLPNCKEYNKILNELFSKGYLPFKFHTHPVQETNFLCSLTYSDLMSETSDKDQYESLQPLKIGNQYLLMPRALIVNNAFLSNTIFIGVYNGFIAPNEFENSKKKIQKENFNNTVALLSSINLKDTEKFGLSIGAALLLYAIVKNPKFSLPVIFGLSAIIPLLMTNTKNIDNPFYFNKLSYGSADIFIPKS
ncbi:MAG: hypothetical protein RSE15_02230 [Flavobacterium sp.]|uniref:hypothetical protein n=1 Tax=Flavobacterium sp. TaxID=239 RepID=UPI002B4A9E55|nr:hypothetical protein [Flavobacterium sp.]WRH73660.1 MAG: hypothetical protein RSE15_02230 [Flavobacterium sp.]